VDVAPDGERPEEVAALLRHLRLDLEYDGTDFAGWQRQAVGRTVQEEVETALARVLGSRHPVVASGRTDAGVHARGLVASTRTRHPIPADELARALDALLPEDVGVLSVRDAPPGFHARKDAAWKWYRYSILLSRAKRPLERRFAWRCGARISLDALRAAAAPLVGRHDFRSFQGAGGARVTTVRTLHALEWTRDGSRLWLDAVGDGFLHHMVRTLVGTMVAVAREPDPGAESFRILAACDRRVAGGTAPAHGLCLMAVALRGEPLPPGLPPTLAAAVESGRASAEAPERSLGTQVPGPEDAR
jgi:tRNA pseudouridine38-40 synthase